MKTLLALLTVLLLTLPMMAQDDECAPDEQFCWHHATPTPTPIMPPMPTYQPGAVSILIPALSEGWYTIEWFDDGKWWLVVDHAHPSGIVLQSANGYVELIGRAGQDTDPTHYRLIQYTPEPAH